MAKFHYCDLHGLRPGFEQKKSQTKSGRSNAYGHYSVALIRTFSENLQKYTRSTMHWRSVYSRLSVIAAAFSRYRGHKLSTSLKTYQCETILLLHVI